MKHILTAVVLTAAASAPAISAESGRWIVDAGTEIAFGQFTYEDATVDISEEFANPNVGVEYVFPDGTFSLGIRYAASENAFSLDYTEDDKEKHLVGTMDAERRLILPFVRIGPRDGINVRLGASIFDYEFRNAQLDETRHGVLTKQIRDGIANGDFSVGIDLELTVQTGSNIQFGIVFGGAFYPDAMYDWTYRDDLKGGAIETGTAETDAATLRIGPELTFRLTDNWRVIARYTLSGTYWIGSKDEEDEDYAGFDIFSAGLVGLRYDCAP